MATEILQKVFDLTRSHLGDTAVPGGEVETNAVLQLPFETAWNRLYSELELHGSPRVIREVYVMLAAYTQSFQPAQFGINDLAEIEYMQERGNFTSQAIASTDTNSPITVTTTAPHGLSNLQEVIVSGVMSPGGTPTPRAAWGRFFVTVLDPSNVTLMGSFSDGNPGIGGTISVGGDDFDDMDEVEMLPDANPQNSLLFYQFEEGILNFRGATTDRQLKITYSASGIPPNFPTQSLGLDDCQTALAYRTAEIMANAKGWYPRAALLKADADMATHRFIQAQVKGLQRMQFRRQPFRSRRYTYDNNSIYL